jgi:hypothetical protein
MPDDHEIAVDFMEHDQPTVSLMRETPSQRYWKALDRTGSEPAPATN